MELEFCKHFKDATNLLLMMDHDSGYVEGAESYTLSSNESDQLIETVSMKRSTVPENFFLNEDALLETPEIPLNLGDLAHEINNEDYEETRRLFFSPSILQSSVQSRNSSNVFSGLEDTTSSEVSSEIPMQPLLTVNSKELSVAVHKQISEPNVNTTSISDMSLEDSTFDPKIIELDKTHPNCSLISPCKGFSSVDDNSNERIVKTNLIFNDVIIRKSEEILQRDQCLSKNCEVPKTPSKETTIQINEDINKKVEKNEKTEIDITVCTPHSAKIPVSGSEQLENCDSIERTSNNRLDCSPNFKNSIDESIGCTKKIETSSNLNPLGTVTNTFDISKEQKKLTLVFSKTDKENGYCVKRKFPSLTPDKNYKNPIDPGISPDMFGDEISEEKQSYFEIQNQGGLLHPIPLQIKEKYENKLDQKLLKRTQQGMNGLQPPNSVTVIHMSVNDILTKLEENKVFFWNNSPGIKKSNDGEDKDMSSLNSSSESNCSSKSLLINVDLQTAKSTEWSDVLNLRYHGLYHNCSKVSEEIVDLCDKYQKRFVGAETQSTCTIFETQNLTSPFKRRMAKPKWGGKSPGRRLSHLARRRITFSSANLQAGGSSLAGSRARQILVDAKKLDLLNRRKSPRKSPRKTPRKTPNKSPKTKTRTPSSSAKKKLAIRFRKLTGEFEKSLPSTSEMSSAHRALFKSPDKSNKGEGSKVLSRSTKRALFQSPNRDTTSSLFANKSQDFSASEEKVQLRRALFASPRKVSPFKEKKSPFKHALRYGFEKKRKRSESDDIRPTKMPRSMSMDVRPGTSENNKPFMRTQSELNISLNRSQSQLDLTDVQKKKLQWAVYSALQTQNITNSHPQWKVWASVLGRATCRIFTSQMASRGVAAAKSEVGTTERMNRIARRYALLATKGKSVEEIISEYLKCKPRVQKPQGYVAPEDYNNIKNKVTSDIKENVFQDRANTIKSWEKQKFEQIAKPATDNKIERIRKVINFGDDR